jgi:hypothetical protein
VASGIKMHDCRHLPCSKKSVLRFRTDATASSNFSCVGSIDVSKRIHEVPGPAHLIGNDDCHTRPLRNRCGRDLEPGHVSALLLVGRHSSPMCERTANIRETSVSSSGSAAVVVVSRVRGVVTSLVDPLCEPCACARPLEEGAPAACESRS